MNQQQIDKIIDMIKTYGDWVNSASKTSEMFPIDAAQDWMNAEQVLNNIKIELQKITGCNTGQV